MEEWYKVIKPSWWKGKPAYEEVARVLSHEAEGIGFYYGVIMVETCFLPVARIAEKVHLRRGLRLKSFFSRVVESFFFRRWRRS